MATKAAVERARSLREEQVGRLKAQDIREALHKRFIDIEYVTIEEAPDDVMRTGGRLDFLAISTWSSRGYQLDGVEIKVSLADWRLELNGAERKDRYGRRRHVGGPAKSDWWWRHVHRFWIAVPADIAKTVKEELPPTWGLLSVNGGHVAKIEVRAPVNKSPEPFTWAETIGLFRACHGASLTSLQRARDAGREEGEKSARIMHPDRTLQRDLNNLQERVEAWKDATGIDLRHYFDGREVGRFGKLFRAVVEASRQDDGDMARTLRWQAQSAERFAEQLHTISGRLDGMAEAFLKPREEED